MAAQAGLPVSQAAAALNALAVDTGATLQVSEAGDLLYLFQQGVRAALAAKSWRLRLAPALQQARERGAHLVRVAFGSTLVINLGLLVAAITLVSASSSKGDDDDSKGGGGGGMSFSFSFRDFNPEALHPGRLLDGLLSSFYFWDMAHVERRRARRWTEQDLEMGLFEARRAVTRIKRS